MGIMNAEQIIEMFRMKPLEGEGGYYVETYRSAQLIKQVSLPLRYGGDRRICSAILYLLTPDTFSRLHRLYGDEVWHFYLGDPVTMLQLHADGSHNQIILGHDIQAGQQLQTVVPAGTWQGAFLNEGGNFALMGTTMAPGFDFKDFEAGDRNELVKQYPNPGDLILDLTGDQ